MCSLKTTKFHFIKNCKSSCNSSLHGVTNKAAAVIETVTDVDVVTLILTFVSIDVDVYDLRFVFRLKSLVQVFLPENRYSFFKINNDFETAYITDIFF